MSQHCTYCTDQPRLRGTTHCVSCGWSDLPLVDDRCQACYAWETGERPLPEYDSTALLFTAIVEQAVTDKASVRRKTFDRVTPTYCDHDECDQWTFACASEFVDVVRACASQYDGDLDAVMLLVAAVATDAHEDRAAA